MMATNEEKEADKQAKEELKRAEKQAEQVSRDSKKRETERAKAEDKELSRLSSAIKHGKARLLVNAPGGLSQLADFEKNLDQADGLEISWSGGSVEEGPVIMVQGSESEIMARMLKAMPAIHDLRVKNGKILVTLS